MLTNPGNVAYTDKKTGQLRDPNDLYTWSIGGEYTDGTNILGLVFFAGQKHLSFHEKNTIFLQK